MVGMAVYILNVHVSPVGETLDFVKSLTFKFSTKSPLPFVI